MKFYKPLVAAGLFATLFLGTAGEKKIYSVPKSNSIITGPYLDPEPFPSNIPSPSAIPITEPKPAASSTPSINPEPIELRIYEKHKRINYNGQERDDVEIRKIIIHTAELDTYHAIKALTRTEVASHYLISNSGNIYRIVDDNRVAVHTIESDENSIGIEHEGYANDWRTWIDYLDDYSPNIKFHKSAMLSAYLSKKYNIPIDTEHIVPHGSTELRYHGRRMKRPYKDAKGNLRYYRNYGNGYYHGINIDGSRYDPGRYWRWEKYLELVQYYRNSYIDKDLMKVDVFSKKK